DLGEAGVLERFRQELQRRLGALAKRLDASGAGQTHLEAVLHSDQIGGETLHGEFVSLLEIARGALAYVLDLGERTQIKILVLGGAGFGLGQSLLQRFELARARLLFLSGFLPVLSILALLCLPAFGLLRGGARIGGAFALVVGNGHDRVVSKIIQTLTMSGPLSAERPREAPAGASKRA